MDRRDNKAKGAPIREMLLKQVKGSKELEMSWWRKYAYISLLEFEEFESGDIGIVADKRSLFSSEGLAFHSDYAG